MKFHFGFLLAGILTACTPAKEVTPVFPRYFTGDKITVTHPLRLLLKGGEIKDPTLIQAFVNRHSLGSVFSFENTAIQGDTALYFTSPDTLQFSFVAGKHTVQQTGKEFTITGPQTSDEAYPEELERYFTTKSLRAGDTGQGQRVYKAYGDYNYLELPVLSYFFKSSKGYTYGGGRAYTELDESSARNLPAGDTLLVKAYRLGVKAQ